MIRVYIVIVKKVPPKARINLISKQLVLRPLCQEPCFFNLDSLFSIDLKVGRQDQNQLEFQTFRIQLDDCAKIGLTYNRYVQTQFGQIQLTVGLLQESKAQVHKISKKTLCIRESQSPGFQHFKQQRLRINKKLMITKNHQWYLIYRIVIRFALRKTQIYMDQAHNSSFTTFYDSDFTDPEDDKVYIEFDQLMFQQFGEVRRYYRDRIEQATVQNLLQKTPISISKILGNQTKQFVEIPIFLDFKIRLLFQFTLFNSKFIQNFAGYLGVKVFSTNSRYEPSSIKVFLQNYQWIRWTLQPLTTTFTNCLYNCVWSNQYLTIRKNNSTPQSIDIAKQAQNLQYINKLQPIIGDGLVLSDKQGSIVLQTNSPFNLLIVKIQFKNSKFVQFRLQCKQLAFNNWLNKDDTFLFLRTQLRPMMLNQKWSIRDSADLYNKKGFQNIIEKRKLLEHICLQIVDIKNLHYLLDHQTQKVFIRILLGSQYYQVCFKVSKMTTKQVMESKQEKQWVLTMKKNNKQQTKLQSQTHLLFLIEKEGIFYFLTVQQHQINQLLFQVDSYMDSLAIRIFTNKFQDDKKHQSGVLELSNLILPNMQNQFMMAIRMKEPNNPIVFTFRYKIFPRKYRQMFGSCLYHIGYKPSVQKLPQKYVIKISRKQKSYFGLIDCSLAIKLDTKIIPNAQFYSTQGLKFKLQILHNQQQKVIFSKIVSVNCQKQDKDQKLVYIGPQSFQIFKVQFADGFKLRTVYIYVSCRSDQFIDNPFKEINIYIPSWLSSKMKKYEFYNCPISVNIENNKKKKQKKIQIQQNQSQVLKLDSEQVIRFFTKKWYQLFHIKLQNQSRHQQFIRFYALPLFQLQKDGQDPITAGFKAKEKNYFKSQWKWTYLVLKGKKLQFLIKFMDPLKLKQKEVFNLEAPKVKKNNKLKAQFKAPKKSPTKKLIKIKDNLKQVIACDCGQPAKFVGKCIKCLNTARKKDLNKFLCSLTKFS